MVDEEPDRPPEFPVAMPGPRRARQLHQSVRRTEEIVGFAPAPFGGTCRSRSGRTRPDHTPDRDNSKCIFCDIELDWGYLRFLREELADRVAESRRRDGR